MKWFHMYERDLTHVFRESEHIISQFPPPLHTKGLSYLSKFNVLQEDSATNYICYLLPFWLQETTGLSNESVRRLSLGNVFAMLYFFIQDDLMDSASPAGKDKLPLGNLFYMQFLDIYRDFFPSESPIWAYNRLYIHEWSDSVTNENRADYFHENPLLVARKAAPLKLSSTGALLLSDQAGLVPEMTDFVDHVLVTLQMSDDWVDWQEDLDEGNYNCLLSMIQSKLSPDERLTTELVHHYIAVRGILNSYTTAAEANHNYIKRLNLQVPHLLSFHEYMLNALKQDAKIIEEEKLALQKGGLSYWMLNNIK